MANKLTIQHKRSSVAGNQPTAAQIAVGELAINFADQKLYTKDASGTIIPLGGGSKWTDQTGGISRADKITVGASAAPLTAIDVTGSIVRTPVVTTGTMDVSVSDRFTCTITGGTTNFNFTGTITGKAAEVILRVTNGGLGSLAWPASVTWEGGTAPTFTTAGTDVVVFFTSDGGTSWRAHGIMLGSSKSTTTISGGAGNTPAFSLVSTSSPGSATRGSSVGYNGTTYVMLGGGASGGALYSTDGAYWYTSPSSASITSSFDVVWNGTKFVSIGDVGATSTDGITWTVQPSFATAIAAAGGNTAYDCVWNGSLFVAVGKNGLCVTSPDGITWTARTSLATATGSTEMHGVTWGNGRFVAVGKSGKAATSTDGITWTNNASFTTATGGADMGPIEWNGTNFVSYGNMGGGTWVTSSDGLTWTVRTAASGVRPTASASNTLNVDLIWDSTNSRFIAASDGGIHVSYDNGLSWFSVLESTLYTTSTTPTYGGQMSSIVMGGDKYIISGQRGITNATF